MPPELLFENVVEPLREFASTGEEASFHKIVNALGGLVFSSALRRTGDAGLAEEVTQNVFAILARKAKRVAKHPSPEGWIFTTTRLESAMAMRKRHQHQRKLAALVEERTAAGNAGDPEAEHWQEALPHLNTSLDRLSEADREILLARFFSDNSFKEIAQRFGKSEAACKMRVKRSLEKMRSWMSQRGVGISATALATGLGAEFARALPASVGATLPANSLATSVDLSMGKMATNALQTTTWLPLTALLAAATTIIAVTWVAVSQPEFPNNTSLSTKPEKQTIPLGSALAPDLGKRKAIKLGSTDWLPPVADAPSSERRPGFWLPSVEIENASAKQALEQLREQYLKHGGHPAIAFDYELADDEPGLFPVTLSLGNATVEQALRRIGVEAGTAVDLRPGGFALVAFPEGGTGIETKKFRVPPDFLSRNGVTRAGDLLPGVPATATLEFLPATSEMIVTGDSRLLARATSLVDAEIDLVLHEIMHTAQSVYAPDDRLGTGARLLSDAEAHSLIEEIRTDEDCELLVNPTVVTRPEQTAMLETLRSAEVSGEQTTVGLRLALTTHRVAYSLNLTGEIEMSTLGKLTPASLRGATGEDPATEVERESVTIELTLDSSQSAIFELLADDNGERFLMIVSPQLIDPSGQPIRQ